MKKWLQKITNMLVRPFGVEVRSVYVGGRLFRESFAYLKKVVIPPRQRNGAVIDVGVADGTPELYEAFPASQYRYLLIEANPVYKEIVETLGKSMSAAVEKVFCGDHDGTESFTLRNLGDAGKASKYKRKTAGVEQQVQVPCCTLDTLVEKHALPSPYIVKIDVEGAELDVLRGSAQTLKHTDAVIVEAPIVLRKDGASSFAEITHFMHERGFAVFDIAEMSYERTSGFLNLTNIVFIRKNNALWEQQSVFKK